MKVFFLFSLVSFYLFSCTEEKTINPSLNAKDEAVIEDQLRKILRLQLNDSVRDFEVSSTDGDALYSGIDWVKFDRRFREIAKDSLFTLAFLDEYKAIAFGINLSLKNKEIQYRVGEENPFFNANIWCDCQDFEGWEKRLKINSIRFLEGQAVVSFSLGQSASLEAKFNRIRNSWRCSSWSSVKLP